MFGVFCTTALGDIRTLHAGGSTHNTEAAAEAVAYGLRQAPVFTYVAVIYIAH